MTDQISVLLSEERRFPPPADFAAQAHATQALYDSAARDRLAFWADQAARARLDHAMAERARVEAAPRQVVRRRQAQRLGQLPRPAPRPAPRRNKAALIWEGEPGDRRALTYWDLYREVGRVRQRAQAARRAQGRPRRDLPADDSRGRDRDARLRAHRRGPLGGVRRLLRRIAARPDQRRAGQSCSSPPTAAIAAARSLPLKRIADEALERLPDASSTWWWCSGAPARRRRSVRHDAGGPRPLVAPALDAASAAHVRAGADGRRGPALHPLHLGHHRESRRGSSTPPAATSRRSPPPRSTSSTCKDEDVFWCTADIGWVTGHSYVVYGPLANGATVLMYEGAPDWPERDRFWEIMRALRRDGLLHRARRRSAPS